MLLGREAWQNEAKFKAHLCRRYGNATKAQWNFFSDNRCKNRSLLISQAANGEIPLRIIGLHNSSGHISGPIQA
jgi:hypothetical protein